MEILGNIHSIETCGTVDGPGLRFVVFVQGCPMRCMYCHNPDTWSTDTNKLMSADEILQKYNGVKEFCKGGITVTGGEPLLQIDFLTDLFKKAKAQKIHTAIDTSGVTFTPQNTKKIDELVFEMISNHNSGESSEQLISNLKNRIYLLWHIIDWICFNNNLASSFLMSLLSRIKLIRISFLLSSKLDSFKTKE